MDCSTPGLPVYHHTPGVYSNSCSLSLWCHPAVSSSVVPFSSCLQSFPASGSFPVSQCFASGGQSIGVSASASVLPVHSQDWFTLGASVHHLLNVATQEYLPTELWWGSLSWCPAHRKCWVSALPLGYRMWLSQHLWTWVAAGRHLCPPHGMAQALFRFPPFLLCSMLDQSGEVAHAELEKAGKKRAPVPLFSR